MTPAGCVLALDLGTTAFKAAAVTAEGVVGRVTVAPYGLDYGPEGSVTCDARVYVRCALRALAGAARSAREAGAPVEAVGLASQAQTFVQVDAAGTPMGPAVVWTDASAVREAEEAAAALPDFARACGFPAPNPMQLLPKLMRLRGRPPAHRYLLLNEWVALSLTGQPVSDTVNQGMGGLLDIRTGRWNQAALDVAGLTPDRLAVPAPAARCSAPLAPAVCRRLGLQGPVPLYTCGNDQSCAAIGAGIEQAGDVFANFGTAMVVYSLKGKPCTPSSPEQIAGVSPLAGKWFVLGVESECGNVLEWLAGLLYARQGVGRMLERALRYGAADLPRVTLAGGGALDLAGLRIGTPPEVLPRALAQYYAERFASLLQGVAGATPPRAIRVGGGLSRSTTWIEWVSRRSGVKMEPTPCEHPGLAGIARIISAANA